MTALRGDTPKHEDTVKKCIFNCKVSIKRKGEKAADSGKTDRPPLYLLHKPVNGCLAWAVQLSGNSFINMAHSSLLGHPYFHVSAHKKKTKKRKATEVTLLAIRVHLHNRI